MAQTKVFLTTTGAGNWPIPLDCNLLDYVESIGAGASGGAAGATNYGFSGSGGAYSKALNQAVTPGGTLPYNTGAGGAPIVTTGSGTVGNNGGDSWIGNATYGSAFCAAKGGIGGLIGPNTTSIANNPGGAAASGIGSTKYSGGAVGPAVTSGNVPGAGGAAGPNGDGLPGVTSSGGAGTFGRPGGAGDNGSGGAGGNGSAGGTASNGAAGAEFDATHGSGGGGGASAATPGVCTGGNGGLYGAGGGAAAASGFATATSGAGANGINVLTYTPIPPSGFFMFIGQQSKLSQAFFSGTLFCSVLSMRLGKFIRDTLNPNKLACAN